MAKSHFSPASQILERHEALFLNKKILVLGDIQDDYPTTLSAEHINVHCTQFHTYLTLDKRKKNNQQVVFTLLPESDFYSDRNLVIYYWPKNKAEAQFQLSCLLNQLPKDCDVLIVGENRVGIKSAESLLAGFGSIQKIDSARRCSLYHFVASDRLAFNIDEWWLNYHLNVDKIELDICGLPGVFSQKQLDVGSELLLNALIANPNLIRGKVLDMGCGCGVLSAVVGKLNPNIQLTLCDVSAAALTASRATLQANGLEGKVVASDVFSHINDKYDLIISNPPFHDGKEVSYLAVDSLINQAKKYLTPNGHLCIVANTFLPYHQLLSDVYGQVEVLLQTSKFRIYLV